VFVNIITKMTLSYRMGQRIN